MAENSSGDLMPTEQSIGNIASNKELMAGFDDPKVMQAVSDVAQNPANINKYKNNKKVRKCVPGGTCITDVAHVQNAPTRTNPSPLTHICVPEWPLAQFMPKTVSPVYCRQASISLLRSHHTRPSCCHAVSLNTI